MALLGPLETPPLRAGRGFVAAVTALLVSGQGAIVGGRGILAATGALIYIAIAVVSVFFGKALDCDKLEVGMAGVPQGVIKLPAQTHSAEETAAVAKEFKVIYRKGGDTDGPNYTVDHSAGTYVFDPAGRLRLYIKHGTSVNDIAADLKQLVSGA